MGKSKDLATGASYVDASGDTMTGNLLLGSNSIGVGIASPAAKTEIQTENFVDRDAVLGLLRLTGQSNHEYSGQTPSAGTALEFYNRWSSGAAYSVGRISGRAIQGYDGGIQIDVSQNTGSGQTNFSNAMNIDSNGHVQTANGPAFLARATITQTLGTGWQDVGYDTISGTQRGGTNYNTTTSKFTAPVSGWYQFNASWSANTNADQDGTFFLSKNNSTSFTAGTVSMPTTSPSYDGHVICGCCYLAANDTMHVKRYSTVSTTTRGSNPYGGWFSGFLIG